MLQAWHPQPLGLTHVNLCLAAAQQIWLQHCCMHRRLLLLQTRAILRASAADASELLNWRVPAAHAFGPHWWAYWLPVGDRQTNQQGHSHALLLPCPDMDPLQRQYWPQLVLLSTQLLLVPPLLVAGAQQMGPQVAAAEGVQAAQLLCADCHQILLSIVISQLKPDAQ